LDGESAVRGEPTALNSTASPSSEQPQSPWPANVQGVAGEKLMTLEAMKMETTILAEAEVKVAEIHLVAGMQVEAGDVLITMA
jgi:pyruvate carboxylase